MRKEEFSMNFNLVRSMLSMRVGEVNSKIDISFQKSHHFFILNYFEYQHAITPCSMIQIFFILCTNIFIEMKNISFPERYGQKFNKKSDVCA